MSNGATGHINGSGGLTMEPGDDFTPVEHDDGPDLTSDDALGDSGGADSFDTDSLSIEDVRAGLSNLSGGIASAQDVENAARAEEGLPPLEAAGLLDFGPFNPDAALKAIFEKSAEVRELQADFDRKKEAASDAKKELDSAAKALVAIIESLKNRRSQALHPSQPYLKDVSDQAPTGCPWEAAHPGQECPICVQAKAKLINVDVNSEVHPEHEGHAKIAEAARVKNVLVPLAEKLRAVNVYADPLELAGLTTEELTGLIAYADEPTPMPPQLIARCCVAAAPGSMMQVCEHCGSNLIGISDLEVEQRDWYPVNALVGFECEAYFKAREHEAKIALQNEPFADEAAVTEPPPVDDAPRKPRSHAKKNKARKSEPEQERAKQVAAGKQAHPARRHNDRKPTAKKAGKKGKR